MRVQVEGLEDEADPLPHAVDVDPGAQMFSPSTRTSPPVGSSSRLQQRSSVDLPEPDGPMTNTSSRGATGEVDAAQHLRVAEGLAERDDFQQRGVGHGSDEKRRPLGPARAC